MAIARRSRMTHKQTKATIVTRRIHTSVGVSLLIENSTTEQQTQFRP